MSLLEIKKLIKEKNLTPRLNTDSMMKELIWDDQWIGYDDEETHEMKRKFANNLCFGGTMAWSVDFNSGTGDGDSAPISTNGQCGPDNGGFKCEGSTYGDCCSSYGYCGSSETHCGSGCVSGNCLVGQETTDGTCGASAHGSFCGLWPQGSCCSSSGYCGDSEAHCGKGCQSGACLEALSNSKGSGLHSTPLQGAHSTPLQGAHSTPIQGAHSTPIQGAHSTPIQGAHSTPIQGAHSTPIQGAHSTPLQGIHSTPLQGAYSTPIQGIHLLDIRS
jgi:hypothetical protein